MPSFSAIFFKGRQFSGLVHPCKKRTLWPPNSFLGQGNPSKMGKYKGKKLFLEEQILSFRSLTLLTRELKLK